MKVLTIAAPDELTSPDFPRNTPKTSRKEVRVRNFLPTRRFALPALSISCFLVASSAAFAQTYKVIDLGILPGDDRSVAYAVNDAGKVVGSSIKSGGGDPVVDPDIPHAFLFQDGHLSDLGLNGTTSQALGVAGGIDRDGWDKDDERRKTRVTGSVGGPDSSAFLYQDHLLRSLGKLPGGRYSIGRAVNRRGEVAGVADNATGMARAFLYKSGNLIDLGAFSDDGPTVAYGLNDFGDVTGFSALSNSLTADAFLYKDGELIDIGGLPGSLLSVGTAINESRQIAGTSSGASSQAWRWHNGHFTILGTLPGGTNSSANGINSAGEVVGAADLSGVSDSHAFLYSHGKMHDLNGMISAKSGWVLNVAQAINDEEEIVGAGTINGESHAFLLKLAHK